MSLVWLKYALVVNLLLTPRATVHVNSQYLLDKGTGTKEVVGVCPNFWE